MNPINALTKCNECGKQTKKENALRVITPTMTSVFCCGSHLALFVERNFGNAAHAHVGIVKEEKFQMSEDGEYIKDEAEFEGMEVVNDKAADSAPLATAVTISRKQTKD